MMLANVQQEILPGLLIIGFPTNAELIYYSYT